MEKRTAGILLLAATLAPVMVLGAYQMRHSQRYEWEMQDPVDDPPDANRPGEFAFARLRYHSGNSRFGGRYGRSSWGVDSNRADRLFEIAIRRLTLVDSKSVEEVIDIDEGPMFDYPWLYAVEVGRWSVTESQGKHIREFIDRGGFLMVDDFHGGYEWDNFMAGLRQIFPDRQVVDIPYDDQVFHIVGDLDPKVQVPGAQYVRSGLTYERVDGFPAHWRGIYDDKGRLIVAICHNMDLGDAWQYADDPRYPEKFASTALRIGVNYVVYPMTH
jgi:hypothetical protein